MNKETRYSVGMLLLPVASILSILFFCFIVLSDFATGMPPVANILGIIIRDPLHWAYVVGWPMLFLTIPALWFTFTGNIDVIDEE